jgi:hypothetical protein
MENQEALYDDYLHGNLSGATLQDFEAKLANDADFRESFELHKETVRLIEIAAFKKQLQQISETATVASSTEKKETRTIQISRTWFAAAAAMIAVVIVFSYQYMNRPSGPNNLYAKYYSPDAGMPSMMGTSENYSFDDAMVDYKSAEYKEAARKLEALHYNTPANDTVSYYLALSYMGKEDYKAAMPLLKSLSEKENRFRYKAQWYYSLDLLRLEQYEEARNLLSQISQEKENPFSEDAANLLNQWKKSSTFP